MRRERLPIEARRRCGATWLDVLTTLFCLLVGTLLFMAWIGCGISGGAREANQRVQCRKHLKDLGLALHNNHDVDKFFPPGSTTKASWAAYLLPYVDQRPIADQLDPRNGTAPVSCTDGIPLFLCSSNGAAKNNDGQITYLASSGKQRPRDLVDKALRGVFRDESFDKFGNPKTNDSDNSVADYRGWSWRGNYFSFRDDTDGTGSTIALGETARGGIRFAPPFDESNMTIGWMTGEGDGQNVNAVVSSGPPQVPALFSSAHPGGAQFVFVDGATRFISDKIDPDVFGALLTIAGGEDIPEGSVPGP